MPHNDKTVGLLSMACATLAAILGGYLLHPYGIGTMIVGAFIGFALAYVPLRGSEQYWRDLEKDGGPYKD